jgi:hypothetical protein
VVRRVAGFKIVLAVLGAGLLAGAAGYLLAPPLAEAQQRTRIAHGPGARVANVSAGRVHTQLRHAPGPRAANVSDGALHSFVQGGSVETATPMLVIATGTGDGTAQTACTDFAVLGGVTATGTGTVTVTGDADFDAVADDVIWRGVATAENGMAETMFGGKETFSGRDLAVTAAPGMEWIVYGFCADAFGTAQAEEMRARAQELRGR